MRSRNNTRRLTALALTVSFALILFALYKFGIAEAATISVIRVVLVSTLFGSPVSFIYSFTGAVLSLAVMFLLKRFTPLTEITVSVVGGVMHNVGQICAASIMLGTNVVIYYLPFLLLSGVIAGIAVGIASGLLISKVNIDFSYIKDKGDENPEQQ